MPELNPDEIAQPTDLKALTKITHYMDDTFRVPILGIKFGWDPIIGLIPGAGDVAGALISTGHIIAAIRHRVPGTIIFRMFLNVLLDLALGLAPGLGDVVDVFVRHHAKNLKLLTDYRDVSQDPREVPILLKGAILLLILLPTLMVFLMTFGLVGFIMLTESHTIILPGIGNF